jgi:hypothetical protein
VRARADGGRFQSDDECVLIRKEVNLKLCTGGAVLPRVHCLAVDLPSRPGILGG